MIISFLDFALGPLGLPMSESTVSLVLHCLQPTRTPFSSDLEHLLDTGEEEEALAKRLAGLRVTVEKESVTGGQ